MKWPGFIGGSFQPQAGTADNSRTVNFYVEPSQGEGATVPAALYPSPGFEKITEDTQGLARAHYFGDGREFAVVDASLIEIDALGTVTNRGGVDDDRLPATITSNGDIGRQLFITAGRNGYIYDLDLNTLTQIAALDTKAFQGDFLDGYFLAFDDLTSTLYISALGDGTTWSTGTDFAQRSLAGDPWLSMKVCGRFIWLFGEFTTEIWYNTSDTFPFAPHPSGLLNFGIRAQWSVAVVGSAIIWMGKTRNGRLSIMRGNGFTPEIISPFALDLALKDLVNIQYSFADVITWLGHTFYVLGITGSNITWVWDSLTQMWFEWMAYDEAAGQETAWRGRRATSAYDEIRIFDRIGGFLYRLVAEDSQEVEDADLGGIRRIRRCPAPYNENKRVFFKSVQLDLEPGLGLIADPHGTSPQVMLRMSNDGGKTWPVERWQASGKLGEYGTRVEWNRLGQARRRVFEFSVTDRAMWKFTGAYLEAEASDA